MSKFVGTALAASLALVAPLGHAEAATIGPDAGVCNSGRGPAVLVRVDGFKQRTGNVRVQIYGGDANDFLAKGKWLKRVDLPVSSAGSMDVCVALPGAGHYAVAVRHDVDGNGKSGWNDGGGFSRNPRISLVNLEPDFDKVVIAVGPDVHPLSVRLNYRRGLSIGPVRSAR